ncbi:MAG TPA: nuclear transport factor 2 family protein [Candidatus Angelobacter sp.]|nr:nuclear transport factor 2 family protein [Candidatus Angelobacter sp.]
MTHEAEQLERRGWEALSGPDGAAFYDNLMAADGLMVFAGLTLGKAETIRAIAGERPWSAVRLDDVRVVEAGDCAVVAYHATAQRGDEGEYRARMSSVYARIDGRWRLLLHQQSPDPVG